MQYQIFKTLFDEESRRYSELEARSRLYLTVITFYLSVIGFKINDVVEFANKFRVPLILYIVTAFALLLALLFTVASARIRNYERIADPEKIIRLLGESAPTDEDFLDARLIDLAVATNRNAIQNNRVALMLRYASTFIFIGVVLQIAILFLAIVKART